MPGKHSSNLVTVWGLDGCLYLRISNSSIATCVRSCTPAHRCHSLHAQATRQLPRICSSIIWALGIELGSLRLCGIAIPAEPSQRHSSAQNNLLSTYYGAVFLQWCLKVSADDIHTKGTLRVEQCCCVMTEVSRIVGCN